MYIGILQTIIFMHTFFVSDLLALVENNLIILVVGTSSGPGCSTIIWGTFLGHFACKPTPVDERTEFRQRKWSK
jgi:MFS-type transporter involved in bile tolerance (Atg22 family)